MKRILFKKGVKIFLVFTALFLLIATIGVFYIRTSNKKLIEGNVSSAVLNDTLDFHFSSSGHIIIQVKSLKDGIEYPFLLDSGASNMIFKKDFKGLNFKDNGYGFAIGFNGGGFFTTVKKASPIKIGEQMFSDLNFEFKEFNFDCTEELIGIIGVGVMRHLIWKIDFEKNKIYLSRENNQKYKGELIQAHLSKNSINNHLSWRINQNNSHSLKLLIDLGSNAVMCLDEKAAGDFKNSKKKGIFGFGSKGLDGTYKSENQEAYIFIDSINFDSNSYKNLPVYTSPGALNLLGLGFFDQFKTITLDWKNSLLTLEKKEKDNSNFLWNTYGMHLDFSTGKMIVNSIIENSPAFGNGLTVDTEVLEINHKSASNKNEFCSLINTEMEKDSVFLKVSNDGRESFISLTKKPIFCREFILSTKKPGAS